MPACAGNRVKTAIFVKIRRPYSSNGLSNAYALPNHSDSEYWPGIDRGASCCPSFLKV
eukprot:CAMPEP_0174382402 /NCGR_PEP_ID=MMETSP0811_2-20130205/124575_1 /TAXON_ID=73025 ORGANISM="Eutreptiella gymnastica-like, Strain CCMP1594" /NCGR_SAMPLE_ID=MMETSP0811_2 /ASSEMBLY_ACC=CAM_ASM_000667 /LENGTH=57 /DNA_ID=CAMNT_0015535705 /DNA_START=2029 /DNA_END=2202 /DNA_ORIENTATION=+